MRWWCSPGVPWPSAAGSNHTVDFSSRAVSEWLLDKSHSVYLWVTPSRLHPSPPDDHKATVYCLYSISGRLAGASVSSSSWWSSTERCRRHAVGLSSSACTVLHLQTVTAGRLTPSPPFMGDLFIHNAFYFASFWLTAFFEELLRHNCGTG